MVILTLAFVSACASAPADHDIDLSGYSRIVIAPITSATPGESEYFASVLRAALIRRIAAGGKMDASAYPTGDSRRTVRLEAEVEFLNREGKSTHWGITWRLVDPSTGETVASQDGLVGVSGENGAPARDRFGAGEQLRKTAEFQAVAIGLRLGIVPPASSPHS